jgi:hypothetical protein
MCSDRLTNFGFPVYCCFVKIFLNKIKKVAALDVLEALFSGEHPTHSSG